MDEYNIAELKWNQTYRNEISSVNISVISDFDQFFMIEKKVKQVLENAKTLKGNPNKTNEFEKQLEHASSLKWNQSKLLKKLAYSNDTLGKVKESHLLNFFDEIGDLPEYDTYSLGLDRFDPTRNL